MRSGQHTWASRGAVAALIALATLQLWWGREAPDEGLSIARALFPITLIATLVLARANCFESRLAVVLACGGQATITSLDLLFGLPGQPRDALDAASLAALLLPLLGIALVGLDWEVRHTQDGRRRHHDDRAPSTGANGAAPYAR